MGRNGPSFFWEAKRLQDNFAAKLIAQGQLASQHVQMSDPVVDANTWQVDKPRVVIWGTKISHLWKWKLSFNDVWGRATVCYFPGG